MRTSNLILYLLLAGTVGCSSSGGTRNVVSSVACSSTANDSVQTSAGWTRIRSESSGVYGQVKLLRQSLGDSGPALSMDYMLHESPGKPIALVVLIAGGQLDAAIEGSNGVGKAPTSAGANFLVRSAHLFAARGYRVLTIDRPSDAVDYIGNNDRGWALDDYRVSMAHAVDLSQLINAVNTTNLPVVIAGTSRGSISAAAQHKLASMLAISAPLTGGSNGSSIGSGNVMPANISEPVHVSWHVQDGCVVTTPYDAQLLVGEFPGAVGVAISGGFASASSARECDPDHYHGFPGIESCAVQRATDWIAAEAAALPATRPVASAKMDSTNRNTPLVIDMTSFVMASAAGALTYSLPHTSTSLGGTVSIVGNNVTYTPPNGVSGIDDTFVYVVNEAGGGAAHNIVSITIN